MKASETNGMGASIHGLDAGLTHSPVRAVPGDYQAHVMPGAGEEEAPPISSQTIGAILVSNKRLSAENARKIALRQATDKRPFGETALKLKLVSQRDIDFALSQQFGYAYLGEREAQVSREVVAAFKPFSRVAENLRALRSQLVLRWFSQDNRRKVLTLVSPGRREGRSFMAANLAVVFAQQGQRTLLIDGDLRHSRQAALFHHGIRSMGLTTLLAVRSGMEVIGTVAGLPNLSVLPAGMKPPNPQELLGRQTFGHLLQAASSAFDVILIDSPAANDYADADIIAARGGAALVLTRRHQTAQGDAARMAQRMRDSGIQMVGSVLNDA